MPAAKTLSTLRTYASFVKLSHTVFALPFALAGMAAAYAVPTGFLYILPSPDGMPSYPGSFDQHIPFSWHVLVLILCCMVGARSFAMALNRILDRRIDALNPRTARRELPSGKLSVVAAWVFAALSAVVYFTACWLLGDVVFALSPIPILLMAAYPLMKRFTALCHLGLGAALGFAPVGAWVAVRGCATDTVARTGANTVYSRLNLVGEWRAWDGLGWGAVGELAPWVLGAAVMLWVAGFDIIYALQDDEFDRANKLHSIPARFGRKAALWISRAMHAASAACFFGFILLLTNPAPFGGMDTRQFTEIAQWVWAAPCVMLAGMIWQHSLVRHNDLSRVNMAFFAVNGVISLAFGALFVAAWLLR